MWIVPRCHTTIALQTLLPFQGVLQWKKATANTLKEEAGGNACSHPTTSEHLRILLTP